MGRFGATLAIVGEKYLSPSLNERVQQILFENLPLKHLLSTLKVRGNSMKISPMLYLSINLLACASVGSNPVTAILCPLARHLTPNAYLGMKSATNISLLIYVCGLYQYTITGICGMTCDQLFSIDFLQANGKMANKTEYSKDEESGMRLRTVKITLDG